MKNITCSAGNSGPKIGTLLGNWTSDSGTLHFTFRVDDDGCVVCGAYFSVVFIKNEILFGKYVKELLNNLLKQCRQLTLKIQEGTILSSPDLVLSDNHSTGDCTHNKYIAFSTNLKTKIKEAFQNQF